MFSVEKNSINTNFCSLNCEQNYNIATKPPIWPREFSQTQPQMPYWLTEAIQAQNTTTSETKKNNINFNNINPDTAVDTVGGAAFLKLAHYCINRISNFCAQIVMRGKEFTSEDNVKKVANSMKSTNKLKADIHFVDNINKNVLKNKFPELADSLETVAKGQNAFYAKHANIAVAPKIKPSLILHELGHAINAEKSKFFGGLGKLRVLGSYVPMALMLCNGLSNNQQDGKENFIEKYAGVIGFASFLPTIIEEGAASAKAIKAAKTVLPNIELKALKKNYFFAWMTYLLAGIGTGIVSKLIFSEKNQNKSAENF